jgi:hypothetical protein
MCRLGVRLGGYVSALNDCGFRAGMRCPLGILRGRSVVFAFFGFAGLQKIEKTKNANCDAYHLRVAIFAVNQNNPAAKLPNGKERRTRG